LGYAAAPIILEPERSAGKEGHREEQGQPHRSG